MSDERRWHPRGLRHLLVAIRRGHPADRPVSWRIATALWPSRYRVVSNSEGDEALLAQDMEEWVWEHLPYRVANFIANTHDMLPFTKGEWSADKDGFVR